METNTENNNIIMEGLTKADIESLLSTDNTIITMPTSESGLGISVISETISTVMDYNINLEVNDNIIGYDLSESANSLTDVVIDKEFVNNYFMIERLVNKLAAQMEDAKVIIKRFIEEHETGSIESNGMAVKYTPATTSTTLDSAKIKSKYPDIAADCSKVSARRSSISIKECN